ncbi:MAG: carboxyl transferase domain-containing protein, partial [Albimonas sp.]|uniref:carboxyl transferase domain-containing protein n=1 Tax=Albimonas sp. TaxID=1872425 RepID=UPI00405789BD
QRRHQKLIEIAPAAFLGDEMRRGLHDAAHRIGAHVGYCGLGTVEFLVAADGSAAWFLEVNPRLQVEHTVTEEATGLDLIRLQLRLAVGGRLADEALPDPLAPRGMALQMRINAETLQADGIASPARGRITLFDLPSGGGLRADAIGHAGYEVGLDYDALLAKLVVHVPDADPSLLFRKAYRAACEARIDGVATNLPVLRALLAHPEVRADRIDVGFVDRHAARLAGDAAHPALDFGAAAPAPQPSEAAGEAALPQAPTGAEAVPVPNDCRLVELLAAEGDRVAPGQTLAITEAMKMEFAVTAPFGGVVASAPWSPGDALAKGAPLLFLRPDGADLAVETVERQMDPDHIRPDLQALFDDRRLISDEGRPEAVAKRHATRKRTARENLADLCDPGSFREFGAHALAAQRGRRSVEELKRASPADGVVTGLATINAGRFGPAAASCAVMAYDYTVFAGTQGIQGHLKKNRLFRLAETDRLPLVMFVEGGGGRPGDTDELAVLRLHNPTFANVARLKSLVPVISVVSGRCFAGNAALAAASDVIVATRDASLGMGGPAMIEGGGLGRVAAEAVGPVSMQAPNGVLDLVVEDEAEAVAAVKTLLAFVQGPAADWTAPDPRMLRHVVPQEPRRAYRMQDLVAGLADEGSVVVLREEYGLAFLTAFARIEGRPVAILANNPEHLGGAIDAAGAAKAAEFAALVEKLRLPLLKLCDTPGFMVGPAAEAEGLVRQAGRLFAECAKLTVPQFTVVTRKAYGLGALAMVSGDAHGQGFTIAWPTGHFGKMGLEGQVRLGHRQELAAIEDPVARQARERELIDALHHRGSPQNAAAFLSVDEVIDPAETRAWIVSGLHAATRA